MRKGQVVCPARRPPDLPWKLVSFYHLSTEQIILHRWKTRQALKKASFIFSDSKLLLEAAEKLSPIKKSDVIMIIQYILMEMENISFEDVNVINLRINHWPICFRVPGFHFGMNQQ